MLNPTLTNSGIALMVKAFCGEEIQFTKLKIGNGNAEGIDIKTLTDLINPIKTININRMDRNENNVVLVGTGYDNSDIETDITWNEVGVYANDTDEGEILFAYINTEEALEILKSNASGVNIENNLSVMLLISSDISVSAVITSIVYASKQEFTAHVEEKNPHGTRKEDIGLSNVENLAISDQVPNFEKGKPLTNINKGDKVSDIVAKVWAAIDKLTKHITDSNPHSGSAPSSHEHNTSDITSGILPISRGGTGASSVSTLQTKLGLKAARDDTNDITINTNVISTAYNVTLYTKDNIAYLLFNGILAIDIENWVDQSGGLYMLVLNSRFYPIREVSGIGIASNKEIFTIRITTDGLVRITSFGVINIPQGTHIRFQISYPTIQ